MKDIYILAIETSCDETSCAVVKNGKDVLSNIISSQIETHTLYGGVIPEIASRLHAEKITIVIDEAIKQSGINKSEISAVAFTQGPGLVGALLVGIEAAKAFAFCNDIPIIATHHIAGHIYANNLDNDLEFPLLALVVSGGHTELIYMENHLKFEKIISTADDAIGETFDKVARVLDLPYPGGPHVDKLAKNTDQVVKLNYSFKDDEKFFSYSGLKTAVINYVNNLKMKNMEIPKEEICNTFQNLAIEQVLTHTKRAISQYKVNNLIIAGGVAANSCLRETFSKQLEIKINIPPLKYCTDNAAMIGAVAYYQFIKDQFSNYCVNANSGLKLGDIYG